MKRRRRKAAAAFLAAMLLISGAALASETGCRAQEAESAGAESAEEANTGDYGWVQDGAGLLTSDEAKELDDACAAVSGKYDVGVSVVTTWDFGGGDIKGWQQGIFDEYGLGLGTDDSGIMLAVSMAGRDWGIEGFGDARAAFNEYGRNRIGELIVEDLSDGNYYAAFSSYVSMADEFLEANAQGAPYSEDNRYQESVSIALIILVSLALSFVVSLVIVLIWKKGMNTRVLKEGADEYIKADSFKLSRSSDVFLYHTVSRTEKREDKGRGRTSSNSSGTSGKF